MSGGRLEATIGGPHQNADATSVMRTNKARAQAAQFLLQECDNAAPLLPLDPSQRISLHRQLRSRYNSSQIPFSALSCSRYITANDVAQLADIFHEFNLFAVSTTVVEMSGPPESRRSSAVPTVKDQSARRTTLTSASPAAGVKKEISDASRRTSKSVTEARATSAMPHSIPSSASLSKNRVTSALPVTSNWRLGECPFQGDGMTLLRDVAEPPPPRVIAPLGRSSRLARHGPPSTLQRERSASPVPVPPPSSSAAVAGALTVAMHVTVASTYTTATATTTAAAAAVVDDRDIAEAFTSESNDCAVTMNWVVEVLLEMILANYDAASRKGSKAAGDDGDGAGTEQTLGDTSAGATIQQTLNSQARSGDYTNVSSATMNNTGIGNSGHSFTTSQVRRRDSRMELLLSAKAELTAWADELKQTCDQREHLVAWQQCALQEEVLERYQLCVVHASRAANLHISQPAHVSDVSSGGFSKSATLAPDVLTTDTASMECGASVDGPLPATCGNPPRFRRANVSWGKLKSIASISAPVSAPSSATPAVQRVPALRPTSAGLSAATGSSPHAPRGFFALSAPRQESARHLREGAALPEVLDGLHPADHPVSDLFQLLECSTMDSLNLDTAMPTVGGVETSALTNTGVLAAEHSYITAKARMCAPEFKDLLLCPTDLNAFLWESPAAQGIAMEEELRMQQRQQARSVRSTKPSTAPAVSSEFLNQSIGDASRTLPHADTLARMPSQRKPSQQQSRRRRAVAEHRLVCWSDVASNLLMGLETTWRTHQYDFSYVRVPTTLLEDMAEGARTTAPGQPCLPMSSRRLSTVAVAAAAAVTDGTPNAPGQPIEYEEDENEDSADESQGLTLGAAGKGGQCRRRRLNKPGGGVDAVALQQRALLLSNLGAAAEAALRALHAYSADHVAVSPTQKYIVTSSKDGMVKVWETSRGQFVDNILNVGQSWVLYMCFLHGGEYLLVATSSAEITVVNFPSGWIITKLRGCTSVATAIAYVKQPSTVHTQRYGLKPGECGHHKPVAKQDASAAEYHAASAVRLEKQVESESVPIAARPLIGYAAPTAAFYEEELGYFFFGTLSGMVGCVDLSGPLSRSGLLAAAGGARWNGPLHLYSCVYAHPDLSQERETHLAPTAATAAGVRSVAQTRAALNTTATPVIGSGAAPAGLRVNGVFYCSVGHCVISSDCAGGVVRTSFTTAADTLTYCMGTPVEVMDTNKPIRFMVCCPGGRRFVTVHSDRRALLWAVGRTTTELVHQYPQEAYDIVDACFFAHLQQVALLTADRSIHVLDERGTRAISSIQVPRGLSSRAEDIASVTLKYSANDGEGCVAYLPDAQRIVCGLRGPVLYEPAVRPSGPEKGASPASGPLIVTDESRYRKGSGVIGASETLGGGGALCGYGGTSKNRTDIGALHHSGPSGGSTVAFLQVAFAPPSPAKSPSNKPLLVDPAPSSAAAAAGDRRFPRDRAASFSSMVSCVSESTVMDDRAYEKTRQRLRRQQFAAALFRAQQRLLPYQTYTSAVVGVLLNIERSELHTISTDTWTVWNFETGLRVCTSVNVPDAAEHELALRRRACRLTCCGWSSSKHTRLLLGTRGSRVLTLDPAVGAVVSVTEPLRQGEYKALEDKDVSVIACCGTRTLLCSGRVCEVRRYDLTSAPLPSGEERFVSMQVQLPSSTTAASAALGEPTGTGSDAKGKGSKGRVGSRSSSPRARHSSSPTPSPIDQSIGTTTVTSPITATITSCCVVRESYLCVGTSDTQLFFYRMVDRSSPIQMEVLCDSSGEPDVGRVISLHYAHSKTQDILLAVVDTGVLYVYSFMLQRMISRYSFPCLGANLLNLATSPAWRGRSAPSRPQQPHYLTSVSLTDDATGGTLSNAATSVSSAITSASQRQLNLCCGDSAGYVHVISLTGLFADAAAATAAAAAPGSKVVMKNRDVRVAASFRAATSGVSALDAMHWSPMNARAAEELQLGGLCTPAQDASPSTAFVIFAGSFDGNVRAFYLTAPPSGANGACPHFSTVVEVASAATAVVGVSPGNGIPPPCASLRGTSLSASAVASTNMFAATLGSPLTPPPSVPTETTPILRSGCSTTDGTAYNTIYTGDVKTEDTSYSLKGNSGPSGGLLALRQPSLAPQRATMMVNAPPLMVAGGNANERSTASIVGGETASRLAPVTVGLFGVDVWDLCELGTFTDARQAQWIADSAARQEEDEGEEAEEQMRLPSILDDDKYRPKEGDRPSKASGEGRVVAVAIDSRNSKAGIATIGHGGEHIGAELREEGAVLLRDVLRRSKKRLSQHSVAAAGGSVGSAEDAENSLSLASQRGISRATGRAGASLRSAHTHSPSEKSFTSTSPTVMPGKAQGERRQVTPIETSLTRSIPPLPAADTVSQAGETAVLVKPHTIDEVVSGSHFNTSKGLTLPQIKTCLAAGTVTAAASSAASVKDGFKLSNINEAFTSEVSALTSSLGPQPRPLPFKNQQNPLLRTYPVALLRQMGVLHPQDDTSDVDPVTKQPSQLSAQEAFQRWGRSISDAAIFLTPPEDESHLAPVAETSPSLKAHEACSLQSNSLFDAHGSAEGSVKTEPPSSASSPNASPAIWLQHLRSGSPVAHDSADRRPPSAHVDGKEGERKASTSTDCETAAPSIDDINSDEDVGVVAEGGGSDDSIKGSIRSDALLATSNPVEKEGDELEGSVFLTASPANACPGTPRPRVAANRPTAGQSAAPTTLPAAELEGKTEENPNCASMSTADTLPGSVFNVPPLVEATSVRGSSMQQAQTPSGMTSESLRLRFARPLCVHAETSTGPMVAPRLTSPSLPRTRAQRDLAMIRGALQDLDPKVLKMREDQMMLCHVAGQLDRSLLPPVLPTDDTSPQSSAQAQVDDAHNSNLIRGNSSGRLLGVGDFTARLLREWRQRSGDSAVEASAALVQRQLQQQQQLQRLYTDGPHASHTADDSGSSGFSGGAVEEASITLPRRSVAGSFILSRILGERDQRPGDSIASSARLPSNVLMAMAAARQATPGASFGLGLWPLIVPNEPQQSARRRMQGNANTTLTSASDSADADAAAGGPLIATAQRSVRSMPTLRVQQELQPIQVSLPFTLQNDEGERMWLRRFETTANEGSLRRKR
ncbi:hypothetical protein ABL78_1705 [Leptomonas seymouri]|uniref:Uncharacterized protein n=1 Tax=Leptomonas seymouri TaxID=5684 RepID=A0A0N1PDJ4_LEPSE|nr:hypothetical protein ABL78_1705 [Leptomonas seymouri]|eukprot:KPI89212.1 hypothetical protein ABL78_1705 [Leptomonas seymouri]